MRVRLWGATCSGLLFLLACSDQPTSVSPQFAAEGEGGPVVRLQDECEEESFNRELGEDTCDRDGKGGITFSQFMRQLSQTGSVRAWKIVPALLTLREGTEVTVKNVGGEDHTFTEVEEFGGGIVPLLNELSHNPVMAPECANAEIVEEGASIKEDFDEAGVEKYQCCIHPWMRQIVRVREKE